MFGKNTPIPVEKGDSTGIVRVNSVFYTLQGEGPFSGEPSVFIRLAGCNLRCSWCDTDFESSNTFTVKNAANIAASIWKSNCTKHKNQDVVPLAVITGGEPMAQAALPDLIVALSESGFRVQIETSGSAYPKDMDNVRAWIEYLARIKKQTLSDRLYIVVSPKTPKLHPGILGKYDCLKYVVEAGHQSDEDGLPAKCPQTGKPMKLFRGDVKRDIIYVSPCDAHNDLQNGKNIQAARDAALKYGYKLSLQMHKIVGVE